MTLKEYLFELFKFNYSGKARATTRFFLLNRIASYYPDGRFVTDREMRQAYEDLPICGSSKGLYLVETEEERKNQIKLHWSKIYAYFRKIDVLENYQIESDPIQKELF